MSNSRLNVRIFLWHFHITWNWRVRVYYNDFHKKFPNGWFGLYENRLFEKSDNFDRDTAN